jgi:ABC-2 type transport system ATP-binding protein
MYPGYMSVASHASLEAEPSKVGESSVNRPSPEEKVGIPPAIEVLDLRKSYGERQAVRGISLRVDHGEVFGLLGPNGAGKTTTVEILEGFRTLDSGLVRVLGFDPSTQPRGLRKLIGVVPQEGGLQHQLTVSEVLEMFRRYYDHSLAVADVLDTVGLTEQRNQRIGTLSGGQQRRVDLAVALVGDPKLLFLDEPTTGFDPAARRRIWALTRRLAEEGKTILLTTHYMEEAQAITDRVALIVDGRIVAEGHPSELNATIGIRSRVRFLLPDGLGVSDLPPLAPPLLVDHALVTFETDEADVDLRRLLHWADERKTSLRGLEVAPPTLEDTYLHLTEGDDE